MSCHNGSSDSKKIPIIAAVDGRNPPVDMLNIPLFTEVYWGLYIQTVVVWDF